MEQEDKVAWYEVEIAGTDKISYEIKGNAQTGEISPSETDDEKEMKQENEDKDVNDD